MHISYMSWSREVIHTSMTLNAVTGLLMLAFTLLRIAQLLACTTHAAMTDACHVLVTHATSTLYHLC